MNVKRFISMMLAFVMVLGIVPIGEMVVFAAPIDTTTKVKSIKMTRTYTGTILESIKIDIEGENLLKADVLFGTLDKDDRIEPKHNYDTYKSYEISNNKYQYVRIISNGGVYSGLFSIAESNLPTITSGGVTPANGIVKVNDPITLKGSNFDKIVTGGAIEGFFRGDGPEQRIGENAGEISTDGQKIVKNVGDTSGNHSVVFEEVKGSIGDPQEIRIHNYKNLFTVHGELGISDDITMVPNRGAKESYITLEAPKNGLKKELSVFFLNKDTIGDTYTNKNIGTEGKYIPGDTGQKDKFLVRVPKDLKPGRYSVIITNLVDPNEPNIKEKILSSKEFTNNTFTVVDGTFTASIIDMYKAKGPETGGIDSTIFGTNIASFHDSILSTTEAPKILDYKATDKFLKVEYKGNGTDSIGTYHALGDPDEGIQIKNIERTIYITIGGIPVTFDEIESFKENADNFSIKVPSFPLVEGEDPKKDVQVRVETTIIPLKPTPPVVGVDYSDIKTTEVGVWKDKFEYEPVRFYPEIASIVPGEVQVDKDNKTMEDLQMYITGKNFIKYKYGEQNKERIKYPIINIGGGQITLNKNIQIKDGIESTDKSLIGEDVKMEVYQNGAVVDGKSKFQGDKIIMTLPKGTPITEGMLNGDVDFQLWNVMKDDTDIIDDTPSSTHRVSPPAVGKIKFIKPEEKDIPTIEDILPTRARSANNTKAEELTIIGSGFDQDVEILLGDIKITGITVNPAGTEIKFKEPIGMKEGTYQLIIKNEKGMAFDWLVYEPSNTKPSIADFRLKEGTNGDGIYLEGDGILFPSAQVSNPNQGFNSHRFIGTRVMFQKVGSNRKKDMNEYNYKGNTEVIELLDYSNNPVGLNDKKNIVHIDSEANRLGLSEDYQSIIFQEQAGGLDKNDSYFVLKQDNYNKSIRLTNDAGINYVISHKDGELLANGNKKVKIEKDSIKIGEAGAEELILKMKTPYQKNDAGDIVGHKVKITSDKELIFTVNLLPDGAADKVQGGEYIITLRNPGIESAPAKDKFIYLAHPGSKPEIDRIVHINEGSKFGGNTRTIVGSGFAEGAKVSIGLKDIPDKDVTFVSREIIIVKIPKYDGKDIEQSSDGRKTQPLMVLNPDGGNDKHDFIYVSPESRPLIDSIAPNFGPVVGDKIIGVTLYNGRDFRFFETYRGDDPPAGHIDLTRLEDREIWGGSERDKAPPEKWARQLEILPTIFFGNEKANIIRYDAVGKGENGLKSITVEIPKGIQGKVPISLENNDFSISNKVDFEYKKIDIGKIEIKPGTGTKRGNTSAEIRSADNNKKDIFSASKINLFNKEKKVSPHDIQLIRFGNRDDLNMTNISIDGKMDQITKPSSGRIVNNNANVKVGDLEVSYVESEENNKVKETMNFKLTNSEYNAEKEELENKVYEFTADFPEGETEVFLPIDLLTNQGNSYKGFELVKISKGRFTIDGKLSNVDKLIVERGYVKEAKINGEHVELKTPSYYSVGEVDVKVINADGSDASTKYIYTNPSNSPQITDIFREGNPTTAKEKESGKKVIKVDYKGGVKFHIKGSDFMKPSRIDIGNVSISGEELGEKNDGIDHLPKVKDKETYEELVFVMPEVPEDYVGKPPYAFIVTTPYDEKGSGLNAASVSSTEGEFEIYVEFTKGETKPKLTKLEPNKGPSGGGNKVVIEGEDFRKHDPSKEMFGELRVYVDGSEIPKKDITFINSKKLEIVMPQHKSGKVKIKVENPDGVVAEVDGNNDEYTYISSPKITGVVDPDNGDIPVRVISIDGGQKIKIQGSDFDKGAKVIFGPVLKKASENPELQGRRIFIEEGDKVVEYIYETGSGSEGTELEFIDSSNIEVKTPAGKLGPTSVIVINPDDAATEEYKLEYGIPDMTAPQDVRATLIKDEYIRINWREVKDEATKKDGKTVQYEVYVIEGGTREFVGTTGTTGFIFRDIEPNKTYKFLIRSVGKYGSSKPIEESMSNEVKTGAKAGPVDNDGKLGEKTKVDKIGNTANVVIGKDAFTQGSEYVIDMTRGPLSGSTEVVVSISAETVVNQKSKKIKMIGKDYSLDFNLSVFENSTLKSNVARGDAGVRFTVQPVNPSFDLKENNGETIIAAKYLLDAKVFVASSEENVESLNGTMNFALDYDSNMAESRRMKTINLVRYDAYGRRFENIGGNSNYGASTGNVKNLGTYTIIGSRR